MRTIVYHKTEKVEDSRNPQLLVNADIQAFHVCREFLQALRSGTHKEIEEANQDLAPYFTFIRGQYSQNKYYSF